jgi:hypothetical protein
MIGKLMEERSGIPVCGKRQAGGQSPLFRTAQLNIALEEERMIVGETIVTWKCNPCLNNLSRMTASQAQTFHSR